MPDEPLPTVVASGDLRRSLEALRDHLAKELAGAGARDAAPLAKQLRDTLNQLSAIATPEKSVTDELKAKRAARQAEVANRAPGRDKRGARGD